MLQCIVGYCGALRQWEGAVVHCGVFEDIVRVWGML